MVITGERNIAMYRLLTMKAALKLECMGMKHSKGSVYALVKQEFGFKGNKQRVLEQLTAHIESLREVA
jgi:hypothetical protein